ncbi:hypothetical protein [Treponema sp.]|uniref:hypothetical protein n=1 Tax=Treponema sp. TaxID=166 RepID=UPI00298D8370|nr:hypothetical protein [Treponema sp.]MCR5612756.1 hypothetical protein [Treponema sp.]
MLSPFIVPIMSAILGLVMIFAAEPIVFVLIIALGVFLLVSGVYILFSMSKLIDDKNYKIDSYIRGGVSILIGLICVIRPRGLVEGAWKATMIILAIYALCSAALEIYAVTKLNSAGVETKKYIIEIISTIVAAIILFLLPSSFGFTLIKIGGGILIVIAIVLAIIEWRNRDIIEADAPVVDED